MHSIYKSSSRTLDVQAELNWAGAQHRLQTYGRLAAQAFDSP